VRFSPVKLLLYPNPFCFQVKVLLIHDLIDGKKTIYFKKNSFLAQKQLSTKNVKNLWITLLESQISLIKRGCWADCAI